MFTRISQHIEVKKNIGIMMYMMTFTILMYNIPKINDYKMIYKILGFILFYCSFAVSNITGLHSLCLPIWILYTFSEYIKSESEIFVSIVALICFIGSHYLNYSPYKVFHTSNTYIRLILYVITFILSSLNLISESREYGTNEDKSIFKFRFAIIIFTLTWLPTLFANNHKFIKFGILFSVAFTTGVVVYNIFMDFFINLFERLKKLVESFIKKITEIFGPIVDKIIQIYHKIVKFLRPIFEQVKKIYLKHMNDINFVFALILIRLHFLEDIVSFKYNWFIRIITYPIILGIITFLQFGAGEKEALSHELMSPIVLLLSGICFLTGLFTFRLSYQKALLYSTLFLISIPMPIYENLNINYVCSILLGIVSLFGKRRYLGDTVVNIVVQFYRNISTIISIFSLMYEYLEGSSFTFKFLFSDFTFKVLFSDFIQHIYILLTYYMNYIVNNKKTNYVNNIVDIVYLILYNGFNTSWQLGITCCSLTWN